MSHDEESPPRSSVAGRCYVVTGANRGLGFEVALGLATQGAEVVLAVRDEERGRRAADAIRSCTPAAALQVVALDLASLQSVQAFPDRLLGERSRIDGLICNAAVIMVGEGRTDDGFELHWGVNHLGHFALTASLLPLLLGGDQPRVVMVTSLLARWGRLPSDPRGSWARYRPARAYAASKLANLVFAVEMARRSSFIGLPLKVIAAHPGYALPVNGPHPNLRPRSSRVRQRLNPSWFIAQSTSAGARSILLAAGDPDLPSGSLVGPSGLLGTKGNPRLVPVFRRATPSSIGTALWEEAQAMSGCAIVALEVPGTAASVLHDHILP